LFLAAIAVETFSHWIYSNSLEDNYRDIGTMPQPSRYGYDSDKNAIDNQPLNAIQAPHVFK
jgi:hypothetical protein